MSVARSSGARAPPSMATAADERRWAGRLAAAALLAVFVVIAASAWIRLAQAARECPACANRAAPAAPRALAPVRGVHRAAASVAGALVLALALLIALRRALRRDLAGAALVALGLVVLLAAVGRVSGASAEHWVALANPLGGLALAFALAWLGGRARGLPRATAGPVRGLSIAACLLAAGQFALGAWLGTGTQPPGFGALLGHATLGLIAVALVAALSVEFARSASRTAAAALALPALLAPAAGLASLLLEHATGAGVAHALAGAWLGAALARADGRLAAAAGFA